MPGTGRTVYIAGAGIAGLTLALALAKFGATVVVLERHKSILEIGAGVQISPNARRVLNQLGLDRPIAARSLEPSGIDVYPFRARRPLVTLELGRSVRDRFGIPYAVMHRADLVDTLFRACRRFASIDIAFGVRAFDAIDHARGVSVVVDEDGGRTRNARAFAFIGADGVRSATRLSLMNGPEATFAGSVAWRTTLPLAALEGVVAPDRTSILMAPGYHAVCYPLPYRGRINIALFARSRTIPEESDPAGPALPWAALRSSRFDSLMAAAEGTWGFWPVFTVDAPSWSRGGIGLIGDAAHAILPHQAQGAAMAIEDAAILAPLLMTEPSAGSAFARFAAMRMPRIERVARVSRFNGFAFQMEWPFTLVRNAAITLQGASGHLERLRWLYGFDPAPEVNTGLNARA